MFAVNEPKTLFPIVQLTIFLRYLCEVLGDFSRSFNVAIRNQNKIHLLKYFLTTPTLYRHLTLLSWYP